MLIWTLRRISKNSFSSSFFFEMANREGKSGCITNGLMFCWKIRVGQCLEQPVPLEELPPSKVQKNNVIFFFSWNYFRVAFSRCFPTFQGDCTHIGILLGLRWKFTPLFYLIESSGQVSNLCLNVWEYVLGLLLKLGLALSKRSNEFLKTHLMVTTWMALLLRLLVNWRRMRCLWILRFLGWVLGKFGSHHNIWWVSVVWVIPPF